MLAVLGASGGSGGLAGGAAGERAVEVLSRGGGALAGVGPEHLAGLAGLRRAWEGIDLVVASDVDVPLLGEHGAAQGFGPQKGASPQQVALLEAAMTTWAAAVETADPQAAGLADQPGAGAAGGLGYGLVLLGGRPTAGAEAVASAVGLAERAARADVVITGEGSLDWQSLRGKVVARVAAAGAAAGTPVVAVAGQVRLTAEQAQAGGLVMACAVAEDEAEVAASLAAPGPALTARVRQVAASWSPIRA